MTIVRRPFTKGEAPMKTRLLSTSKHMVLLAFVAFGPCLFGACAGGGSEGARDAKHAQASGAAQGAGGVPLAEPIRAPASLEVTSTDFQDGTALPERHAFRGMGCTGENVSPALAWSNAPAGTKSFAIIVHDPDAPTGVGFFHWVVFDLPKETTSLPSGAAGALPGGAVSGHTDFGTSTYGGPCPPEGAPHRYVFTVYALDVERLGLDAQATGALTRFSASQHALAYGRITGTYRR